MVFFENSFAMYAFVLVALALVTAFSINRVQYDSYVSDFLSIEDDVAWKKVLYRDLDRLGEKYVSVQNSHRDVLFRVLGAYAVSDSSVYYIQGLNLILAQVIISFPGLDEFDYFEKLHFIMRDRNLRNIYTEESMARGFPEYEQLFQQFCAVEEQCRIVLDRIHPCIELYPQLRECQWLGPMIRGMFISSTPSLESLNEVLMTVISSTEDAPVTLIRIVVKLFVENSGMLLPLVSKLQCPALDYEHGDFMDPALFKMEDSVEEVLSHLTRMDLFEVIRQNNFLFGLNEFTHALKLSPGLWDILTTPGLEFRIETWFQEVWTLNLDRQHIFVSNQQHQVMIPKAIDAIFSVEGFLFYLRRHSFSKIERVLQLLRLTIQNGESIDMYYKLLIAELGVTRLDPAALIASSQCAGLPFRTWFSLFSVAVDTEDTVEAALYYLANMPHPVTSALSTSVPCSEDMLGPLLNYLGSSIIPLKRRSSNFGHFLRNNHNT